MGKPAQLLSQVFPLSKEHLKISLRGHLPLESSTWHCSPCCKLELLDKDFILSISKADLLDDELKQEIAKEFPESRQPLFFSAVTGEGLVELKDAIWKKLHG